MLFHWAEVYKRFRLWARGKKGASSVIAESVSHSFQATKMFYPALFEGTFEKESRYLARFEAWVPFFTLEMLKQPTPKARQHLLEEAIDRLSIRIQQAGFVGDMGLGPKVKAYAGALNGRLQRYEKLLKAADTEGLANALSSHKVPEPEKLAFHLQKELAETLKKR